MLWDCDEHPFRSPNTRDFGELVQYGGIGYTPFLNFGYGPCPRMVFSKSIINI
jgi:hypothetical protein